MVDPVTANGACIPAIGLGTGRLRGDTAVVAVHAALDSGYRHIDTAAKYGNEVEVGEAVRSHAKPRDDIFVTTKIMALGLPDGGLEMTPEASLKRLGLDYVDLLLLHWPNQSRPLVDQLAPLCRAKREGLARSIGVSNFGAGYFRQACRIASEPIAVNQVERHPFFPQDSLARVCNDLGAAVMAFSPMGRGALLEEPAIRRIAERHGRTPAQIILRWHMEKPMNVAVPSSSNPERIAGNLKVFDFALTHREHLEISALARPDSRVVRGPLGYDWDATPL